MIVYGSHVFTTVFPILYTFYENENSSNKMNKFALFIFYLPYLLIPFALTAYMCMHSEPFEEDSKTGSKRLTEDKECNTLGKKQS